MAWRTILLTMCIGLGPLQLDAEESLRVMSFNIRYGSAQDGANHWEQRRDLVAKTIAEFEPDLLGTQETLEFQAEYLSEQLPGYTYFGRSRMKTPNEHCGIFYKNSRFTWLAGGHFWLSETPEVPESISWDSSLPRMASWVLLSDKLDESAPAVLFVNTHFDHRGADARAQAAALIRSRLDRLREIAEQPYLIVTGDFNTSDDSPPYHALLRDNPHLVDAYRVLHPTHAAGEGTFNGFQGKTQGAKIDWILSDSRLKSVQAEIERRHFDNRYPSDHFPVTAVLEARR